MPGNTFGLMFRVTTFGESHGAALGVVIDGCPPGLPLTEDTLAPDLMRRRPGQSLVTTQRSETDRPEIVSGVYQGATTGSPIAVLFRNEDARSRDYASLRDKFRPGHADFTTEAKYGHRDPRGGGRASARETVARVAAGAVARALLAEQGIDVLGYALRIGDIETPTVDVAVVSRETVDANPVRCPDAETAKAMEAHILEIRKDGDSIGGVAELVARGVPAGLGEPVFDKVKADLAKAILSIPAVTGFEYGSGFRAATMRGSEHNDAIVAKNGGVGATTNRHGGILGGITSGEPIVVRAAIKPTSSIPREQDTVDDQGHPARVRVTGRHDPCLVPRFIPVGEAMVLLVLADHVLRHRAQTGK